MKHTYHFLISQEQIQVLKASGSNKRILSEADIIQTRECTDEQITQHLKAWVKLNKINPRNINFGLVIPRSNVILRQLVLPSHVEDEIRSMVDLQIVKYIPYDRTEVEIDFQILEKMADGYTKVLAVVIPQEHALRYWDIFANAGIQLGFMTISSVGLWLLYKTTVNISSHLGAIIDFDNDQSEICLCSKEYWVNSREIPIGLEKILKTGYEEFIKQWHLTLDNKGSNHAVHVDSVALAQSVRLPMVVQEELSKGLQCPVKAIDVDQYLTAIKNVGNKSWSSLIGVGLSLVLPPIDLVPQAVRLTARRRTLQKELFICAGAFVLAAVVLAGALSMNWIMGHSYLDEMNQKIKDKKVKASHVQQELNEIQALEGTIKGRFIFAQWVDAIYTLLPQGVSLVSINVNDGNLVSIQGTAAVSSDINSLQSKMISSPLFSNVSLDFVNKRLTQEGELNYFKITAVFRPVSAGQASPSGGTQ